MLILIYLKFKNSVHISFKSMMPGFTGVQFAWIFLTKENPGKLNPGLMMRVTLVMPGSSNVSALVMVTNLDLIKLKHI